MMSLRGKIAHRLGCVLLSRVISLTYRSGQMQARTAAATGHCWSSRDFGPFDKNNSDSKLETDGRSVVVSPEDIVQMLQGCDSKVIEFKVKHLLDETYRTTSHPNRQFSTYRSLSTQGAFSAPTALPSAREQASPQGVQGEKCERFKLWMENCQRFSLKCEEQLQSYQRGEKSIHELIEEQEKVVRKITDDYTAQKNAENNPEAVQSATETYHSPQGSQTEDAVRHDVNHLSFQGIQGDNCSRLLLWFQNCGNYGFINCDQQMKDVQKGQKTLTQIFEEQDRQIREIAEYYHKHSSGSASKRD